MHLNKPPAHRTRAALAVSSRFANTDDAVVQTQILDVFNDASDLLPEVKEKLKKMGMEPDYREQTDEG
eukprot:SAG31_NODE_153_length_22196_cov_24.963570_9_plen_68_part_00